MPGGKIIKLTFLNFTLVAGENDDCAGAAADSARVFITNVASHGGKPNNFKICGQKLPPPVYSEGNFIQVRFESGTSLVNKGFNATFQAIDGDSRKSLCQFIRKHDTLKHVSGYLVWAYPANNTIQTINEQLESIEECSQTLKPLLSIQSIIPFETQAR